MGEAARCLIGGGGQADPTRGIRLLREASSRGEADASALLAALCAMGVSAPPNLAEALALLALAAQQGSQKARGQLMVLAGGDDDGTSLDQVDFKNLAASVDLDAWLTPPHKQPLCEAPRIRFLAGFLPKAGCEWLIEVGRGRVAPAGVYDAETGAVRQTNTRSNSAFKLGLLDLDLITVLVRAKIAAAVGVPADALEATQILHYAQGQRFERHFDYLDLAQPGYAEEVSQRGQRIATFLIYLNSNFDGGGTEFCRVGLTVKGETGDGLMFANVDRDGATDPLTLHRGAPPISGEKWLLSQWVRDRNVSGPAN